MSDLGRVKLVLFFTRGISLRTWDEIGMFDREVAIYKRLQEQGIKVSFVTYGDATDLHYADCIPGIHILCNRWGLPHRWYERLLPYLHVRDLWRADVYKTNQTDGSDLALRAAWRLGKPLVARCGYMWSRFAAWQEGADSEATKQAERQEARAFSAADRVVVTAGHMKDYIVEQYGIPGTKVVVIPNYVITNLLHPNTTTTCKPGRLCFVGRLDAQKNLFALIEAIRGLDIELEIIGDGAQREALEKAVREKGANVHFLGNLPHAELPQHFNAAEIFILPSMYEGHPKTLLEAMACGLAVIGTDVPGIREIIQHRQTGYLCGTSPTEIRRAFQDVLGDEALQEWMGGKAREYVVENFSLDRVFEMELALLQEVTNVRKG